MVTYMTYVQIIDLDLGFPCTSVILFSIGLKTTSCNLYRIESHIIENIYKKHNLWLNVIK